MPLTRRKDSSGFQFQGHYLKKGNSETAVTGKAGCAAVD
jgi:hypothetical protein